MVTINPAGTFLAWAANDGKHTQVTVLELASRKTLRNFSVEPGFKVRDVEWANDDTLLFAVSVPRSPRAHAGCRAGSSCIAGWRPTSAAEPSQLLLTEGNKRVLGGAQLSAAHR